MSQKRRSYADEPFLVVRSLASNARRGDRIEDHRHDWHQLIYAATGVLAVSTEAGNWVVPSSWAVWVPARTAHSISFATDSDLRTLYLRADPVTALPGECRVVEVAELLRALILRTVETNMLDSRDPAEAAMALLIRHELARSSPPPFALRQPVKPALQHAASLIASDAPEAETSAQLAKAVGLSVRVLERRFRAETGMTPAHWRRHRAFLFAVEQLAAGDSVKKVAAACGYAAPSAFVAAFRKRFGVTPTRYVGGSQG